MNTNHLKSNKYLYVYHIGTILCTGDTLLKQIKDLNPCEILYFYKSRQTIEYNEYGKKDWECQRIGHKLTKQRGVDRLLLCC